jgi:hypothetical protein
MYLGGRNWLSLSLPHPPSRQRTRPQRALSTRGPLALHSAAVAYADARATYAVFTRSERPAGGTHISLAY